LKKIIITFLLIILLTIPVNALETPKTVGFGNFSTFKGIDGIYVNPATVNLDKNKFNFKMAVNGGFDNNLLRNEYISEDIKDDLLESIENSGWVIQLKGKEGLNLTLGPVGIFSNMREEGNLKFNPDVAEIILAGNQTEAVYSLENSFGNGAVYNDTGINFSYKIPENVIKSTNSNLQFSNVNIGLNYRFLTGAIFNMEASGDAEIGYTESGEPTFSGTGEFLLKHNDFENINGIENLATGSAFDIGVYGDYNKDISLGFSIMNLGSLSLDEYKYEKYKFDSEAEEVFDLVEEGIKKDEVKYKLPRKINIGGEYDWREDVTLLFNYTNISYNHFNDNKISAGAEYNRFKYIPFRLGAEYSTLNDDLKLRTGLGIYLGTWKTEIGISDIKGLFNKSQGLEFGMSSGFSF